MNIQLIDKMGSDLSVVNAARVSFAKKKDVLDQSDEKLIKYLADHDHWSPFGHTTLQFLIKAPVFVARQLVKHQVGLVWNEVSRRYVDDEPEFYMPFLWREKAENKKQGSLGTVARIKVTDSWWWNASDLHLVVKDVNTIQVKGSDGVKT